MSTIKAGDIVDGALRLLNVLPEGNSAQGNALQAKGQQTHR